MNSKSSLKNLSVQTPGKALDYGPTANLFGVTINALSLDQVLDLIEVVIRDNRRLKIGVVNVAKIVNMNRDSSLGEDVQQSDIVLADGLPVVWAAKILGQPLKERVTGIDLMYGIFSRGYRVYCLGATEEVSEIVAEKLKTLYPRVSLAGRRNGYFSEADEEQIAKDIAAAKPDILLVAITSPKKERFMAKWGDVMNVPVVHGVGGSFDVMAGKVKRAPESWQKLGLEWLYRVKQEPGRLWKRYLVTNSLYIGMTLKAVVRRLVSSK